jgi:hypothetical protein
MASFEVPTIYKFPGAGLESAQGKKTKMEKGFFKNIPAMPAGTLDVMANKCGE